MVVGLSYHTTSLEQRAQLAAMLARALAEAAGVPLATFESDLFTQSGPQALRHLVRVVSGLDSLVVGDVQIHGQVRAALRLASASGSLPAPLNGVFERALEASRRIRRATAFGQRPSVPSGSRIEGRLRRWSAAGRQ